MSEKKNRRKFPLEYKRRLVEEYLSGQSSAHEIAEREDIATGFIYRWKTQLEEQEKMERIGELESSGSSPDDARRIREMEEELEAYKAKVAEQSLHIDLLKKLHPSFQSERKSSGFAEMKKKLVQSKRRAK